MKQNELITNTLWNQVLVCLMVKCCGYGGCEVLLIYGDVIREVE